MARSTGVAAVCLAAGIVAAPVLFVGPGSSQSPLEQRSMSSTAETYHLEQESAVYNTQEVSLAGLGLGFALGMLMGLASAVTPVSAKTSGIDMAAIRDEGRTTIGSADDETNSFDLNLNRRLGKELVKNYDIEGKFNGEEVQFQVDESQIPATVYPPVRKVLYQNDPSSNDMAAQMASIGSVDPYAS